MVIIDKHHPVRYNRILQAGFVWHEYRGIKSDLI